MGITSGSTSTNILALKQGRKVEAKTGQRFPNVALFNFYFFLQINIVTLIKEHMNNKIASYKASVGGFVVKKTTDKEEILLVKKNYGALKEKWAFPGGFIDSDENIEKALMREIQEETGIEASVGNSIGFRFMSSREKESVYFIFRALDKSLNARPRKSSESSDVKYFSLKGIKEDQSVSSLVKKVVGTYQSEGTLQKVDFLPEEIKTNPETYSFYLVS